MPVSPQVSYPGVYVQEVEGSAHGISPAPTSITAFIGRAMRGPTDQDGPVLISNFNEFQRMYGGLWTKSELGYAVDDFFLNGGSQAVIVRLWKPKGPTERATFVVPSATGNGALELVAKSPGAWGNQLKMRVETIDSASARKAIADQLTSPDAVVTPDDLFTLMVHDAGSKVTEQFVNVTHVNSPNRLDRVLAHQSQLVAYAGSDITAESMPQPHRAPTVDPTSKRERSVWEDPDAHTGVAEQADDGDVLDAKAFLAGDKRGINALDMTDIFNLLVIPPFADDDTLYTEVLPHAIAYCEKRRAVVLVDPPPGWKTKDDARKPIPGLSPSANAAIYFPRINKADMLQAGKIRDFAPGGAIAGIIANSDAARGVWKAPAGLGAVFNGVTGLTIQLTDAENGELNPLGVNCLRTMPAAGTVIWGARTMLGDDRLDSEWKYLPVRRLALFVEESLQRATQWAVFEPNDEPLWSQLRLSVGAFMNDLFRQGAFVGQSPKDAYFVRCDSSTTTQSDIDRGIVNVAVGFAPMMPGEFIVIYLQQTAVNQ